MTLDSAVIGLAVVAVVAFFAAGLKVFREYERGVCFTLGRFTHVMGPGLVLMIPLIQTMVRVGLRVRVIEVPPQQIITRDNVSVGASAQAAEAAPNSAQPGASMRALPKASASAPPISVSAASAST